MRTMQRSATTPARRQIADIDRGVWDVRRHFGEGSRQPRNDLRSRIRALTNLPRGMNMISRAFEGQEHTTAQRPSGGAAD